MANTPFDRKPWWDKLCNSCQANKDKSRRQLKTSCVHCWKLNKDVPYGSYPMPKIKRN